MDQQTFEDLMAQIESIPGHGKGIKEAAERNPWGQGNIPGRMPGSEPKPVVVPTGEMRGRSFGESRDPYAPMDSTVEARVAQGIPDGVMAVNPGPAMLGTVIGVGAQALRSSPASAATLDDVKRQLAGKSKEEIKALQKLWGVDPDGNAGTDTMKAGFAYLNKIESEAAAARSAEASRIEAQGKADAAKEAARIAAQGQVDKENSAAAGRRNQIDKARSGLVRDLTTARTPVQDDTIIGKAYQTFGAATPLVAGALGGVAARYAKPAIGLTKSLSAEASPLAKAGAKIHDDYVLPGLAGAELGGSVALSPVAAQANRKDPTNPEYTAWQNYRTALPTDASAEIKDADAHLDKIPRIDPSVTDARKQIGDIGYRGQMMGIGALGGLTGNIFGAAAPNIAEGIGYGMRSAARNTGAMVGDAVEGLGSLKGRFNTGAAKANGAALDAEANSANAAAEAAAARVLRDQALAIEQEARLKLGSGTGAAAGQAAERTNALFPDQARLPPPEGASNPAALSFSPEARDQINALIQNAQQGVSRDQVNALLQRLEGPMRLDEGQLNQLVGAFGQRGPGPRLPPPAPENNSGLAIPSNIRPNPSWPRYSQSARESVTDLMDEGKTLSTKGGQAIRSGDVHARLQDASGAPPTFDVKSTQAALKRLRDIMLANGDNPATIKPAEFISKYKDLPREYFSLLPMLAGGAAAMSATDDASAEDKHHSAYQPRRSDGTFKGAPAY